MRFPDGATTTGVLDLWGNIFEWTSAFTDEHSTKAVVRGGHFWRGAGTQWYFPRPVDLFEHNTFLMLSDSIDRSAGIGFRCAANFHSPGDSKKPLRPPAPVGTSGRGQGQKLSQ